MRLSTFSYLFVALASSIAACSSSDGDGHVQQPPRPDAGTDSGIVLRADAGDEKPDASDGGSDTGDGSTGGDPREKIVKACTDLGEAFAKAYSRCTTLTYQEVYDLYIAEAGGPTCPKVVSIRDEGELRGQCIPWFGSVACADLQTTHPSCKEQLQVVQSMAPESIAPHATADRSLVPALRGLVDER
ncbi:hypothetical protein LVJ94_43745 [Pendulispora rubella]|uniref:Secreted protein n=1 Tax=Pendulispora rubella TaxID=2741070 RepID=A0ABZ2L5B6_9BACT